jgi:hypothetical protein
MVRQQLAPRLATLAVTAVLGWAVTASGDTPTQRVWLAADAGHSTAGPAWGRLVIKDGMLTFHGSLADWTTPLSDIARMSRVKGSDHRIEIETMSGDVLRISILGARMQPVSPKKAMQLIQRATREGAPVRRTMASATAPPGRGIR